MPKAQYDIYTDKVKKLVRTLIVKSAATARAINKDLALKGLPVNESDPASWKYYLHLTGRYHETDVTMTVISLDTLQRIEFTRENLKEHTATRGAYQQGSRYYKELVSAYPEQESLINGILHPVELDTALAAEEGTVLWYDPGLVESNETNLIPKLEDWIKRFMGRWNVEAYALADELYVPSQLAVLWVNLPLVVLNLRLANCHTNYAHSFHIQEFLASHGALDTYVSNLTKKQMLWLYRNIRYILRNTGKQSTFKWLVQNILTDRGLPLAAWGMRHNVKDQAEEILPEVEFQRKSINYAFSNTGSDTKSIAQLLQAEEPMARSNALVELEAETEMTSVMKHSLADRLTTKVLESAVLDLTDASPFTLSDCLLNHWLYFAYTGRYSAVVQVDDPHTGDPYTFTAMEAFIVFLYAFNAARGLVLSHLPKLEACKVRQVPTPSKKTLAGLIDTKIVDPRIVDLALEDLPKVEDQYISIASFHDGVRKIHEGELYHRLLYTGQEHAVARGQVEQLTLKFYCDYPCDLGESQTYKAWFQARGLKIQELSELEMDLLATSLLAEATGTNLVATQSLKDLQTAMLKLMRQLSSYSIQYLQTINSSRIHVLDWPAIRAGEESVTGEDLIQVPAINVDAEEINAKGHGEDRLDLADTLVDFVVEAHQEHHIQKYLLLDFKLKDGIHLEERVRLPMANVMRITSSLDPENQDEAMVFNTDQYLPMSPEDSPAN